MVAVKNQILLSMILLCGLNIQAQKKLFPKYSIESVAIGSDVSSMELNVVFQDSKDFIWIGTETGLGKYNGSNFRNFDFTGGKKIATIYDIVEDRKGRIWAAGKNGLFFYNGREFAQSMFKDLIIRSILLDHNDNLIIAGFGFTPRIISSFQMDSLQRGEVINAKQLTESKDWIDKFQFGEVFDITEDDQGNVWIALGHELLKLNQEGIMKIWEGDDLTLNISEIVAITPDSVYWGAETASLYFRNREGVVRIPTSYMIGFHRTDTSLVILTAYNLIKIEEDGFKEVAALEEIRHMYYKDFLQDAEGNYWIATEGSLFKISKQYFHCWSVEDNSMFESNHSITQLQSGTILIGLNKRRNLEYSDHRFRLHQNEIPAAYNSVTEAVLEDKDGRIWFGTSMSGLILESENGIQTFGEESGLIDKTILFVSEDGYGRIWTGGEKGISLILERDKTISFKNYEIREKLEFIPRFMNVICLSSNQCWAFSRNGIYKIEGDELIPVKIKGIEDLPIISQAIRRRENKIMISTLGAGVLGLEIGANEEFNIVERWDKSKGLLSDNVLSLHEDKKSRLWSFSQSGTCVIDDIHIQCYDQRDGWLPLETTHIDLLETKDSIMWVVANSAMITFPVYTMPNNNVSPKVFITDVKLFEGKNDIAQYVMSKKNSTNYKLVLPHNQNFLQFNFTSTSHTRNTKNTFIYQLEGLEQGWNLPTSLTSASYPDLQPGKYNFKVLAINNSGLRGELTADYPFRIRYPWYQKWWAISIYLLLFCSIFYAFYKLQINKKRKEHEAIKMKELNAFQSDFYTNITHEFRTPLTVILGMTEKLSEDNAKFNTSEVRDSLSMIDRNAQNLLKLVNEMLEMSRLESGSMSLNLIQADISAFIKYILESLKSLASIKQVDLICYSEEQTIVMDFDEEKIEAIISNLVTNAIKFSSSGDQIIVHLKRERISENDFLLFKVKDEGQGILENDLPHIFDRFYTATDDNNLTGIGTGVGLALTKELITLMSGKITVKSKVGKGTEFLVALPILNKAPISSTLNKAVKVKKGIVGFPQETTRLSRKVKEYKEIALIIEDNTDVASYLMTCLEGRYDTIHAEDGEEGVDMALEHQPDIIICDVMMPKKNGFKVCEELKSNSVTDHIPIILLTARVNIQDKIVGLSHGADAYLTKPFSKPELFTRIDQLILSRRKMLEKLSNNGIEAFMRKKLLDPDALFVQKAIKQIQENINNSIFGPAFLAKKLMISESQLYRKLKAITGKSSALFIRSIRLQKAKELLQEPDMNISEVAYEVGFTNPSWFSTAFKEEFGFSPSELK